MSNPIFRGDAVPVAQVTRVTPGTVLDGHEYSLKINGKLVTVVAESDSESDLVEALADAVNASTIPEFQELTAEADGATLVLTSNEPGVPFVVTSMSGDYETDEYQVITISNSPTGGTFMLTFHYIDSFGLEQTETTGTIAYNASAGTVQTALTGLTHIGSGNATVTGDAGGPYTVHFTGSLARTDVLPLTVNYSGLTGGDAALVIATIQTAVTGTNEVQTVTLVSATGGTFKLSFDGYQTAALAYNVSTAAMQTALQGLPSIGSGNATVSGSAGSSYVVSFASGLAHRNVPMLAIDASSLTVAHAVVTVTTEGSSGSATSVGPIVAGSGASVADPASAYYPNWTYPGRVTVDDGSGAYCVSTTTSPTEFLVATNFGFAIPGTSTILGIEVSESRYCPMVNGSYDRSVKLTVDGVTGSGVDHSATDAWATSFGTKTWGGATDLWGLTLTPAIINSASFGVVLQATLNGSSYAGYVDWIKVKIYYSDPTTGTNEVQSLAVTGSPAAGTFTLNFDGAVTPALPYSATASAVQTALRGLPSIGPTGVTCTGGPLPGTAVTITFGGTLAYTNVSLIVATSNGIGYTIVETTPGVTGLNEIHALSLAGQDVWGGTFTLTWSGQTTSALAYSADSSTISAALIALSNIAPGEISVTGGPFPDYPIYVEWTGANAETDVALLTSASSLKNGIVNIDAFDPLVISTEVFAAGPNHWNDPTNWTTSRVPDWGDSVTLSSGETDIRYGLRQVSPFTVDTVNDQVIPSGCDLIVGQIVRCWSSNTLPAGLSAGTNYYITEVDPVSGKLKLSTSAGGATVNITGSGTGTHYIGVQLSATSPLPALFVDARFTGHVGLPQISDNDYWEYRPRYLVIGIDPSGSKIAIIGQGEGSGSGLIRLDTGLDQVTLEVLGSGGADETNMPALNWLGVNSANVVTIYDGDFGAAYFAGEVATLNRLNEYAGQVRLGSVTFAGSSPMLDKTGGELTTRDQATLSGVLRLRG